MKGMESEVRVNLGDMKGGGELFVEGVDCSFYRRGRSKSSAWDDDLASNRAALVPSSWPAK